MLFAIVNNEKVMASPKMVGLCPSCHLKVIAKCGEINTWHWAHGNKNSCDSWSEGETEWHKNWKLALGKDYCEISIVKDSKKHIADIQTQNNVIIELQNSPISSDVIAQREEFYGEKMLWVVNCKYIVQNFTIYPRDVDRTKKRSWLGTYYVVRKNKNQDAPIKENEKKFLWDYPRPSWITARRPVFIDLGDENLFWVQSGMGTGGGLGKIIKKASFLKKYGGNLDLLETLITEKNLQCYR